MHERIGSEAPIGYGTSKAPEASCHASMDHLPGWVLRARIKAHVFALNAPSNRQTVPLSRFPAAEMYRYITQWREARRYEARSIHGMRGDNVSYSDKLASVLWKSFVLLLVVAGVYLLLNWWQCQPSVCKWRFRREVPELGVGSLWQFSGLESWRFGGVWHASDVLPA